jgi:hypothetical protein
MMVLRNNGVRFRVVSKDFCYRKAEAFGDAEERGDGGGII